MLSCRQWDTAGIPLLGQVNSPTRARSSGITSRAGRWHRAGCPRWVSAHPEVSGTRHGSDRAVHGTFVPGITPWEARACVSEPSEPRGRIVSHCLQGNLAFGLERQERGHRRGVTPAMARCGAACGDGASPCPCPAPPARTAFWRGLGAVLTAGLGALQGHLWVCCDGVLININHCASRSIRPVPCPHTDGKSSSGGPALIPGCTSPIWGPALLPL